MLLVAKVGECLVVMEVDYGTSIIVLLADTVCITGCCFLLSAAVMTRSHGNNTVLNDLCKGYAQNVQSCTHSLSKRKILNVCDRLNILNVIPPHD